MTAPTSKRPAVRRKPTPKPAAVVAAEVVAEETSGLKPVTVVGIEWTVMDAEQAPIGYALAVETLASVTSS